MSWWTLQPVKCCSSPEQQIAGDGHVTRPRRGAYTGCAARGDADRAFLPSVVEIGRLAPRAHLAHAVAGGWLMCAASARSISSTTVRGATILLRFAALADRQSIVDKPVLRRLAMNRISVDGAEVRGCR
jgi:hypothetical protein